jgi:tetratricopeptide (TPR) repeat protein
MQELMTFTRRCRLLLALGCATSAAWSADDAATRQLVDQARHWQQISRDDLAAGAWQKLLRANANHPEALIRLGLLEARAGHVPQAEELYRRAGQLSPAPTGLAELEAALRLGKNANAIEAARKQAQSGQAEQAINTYRSALGGAKPTGQLGLEYYQTLGATPAGWEEGRRGLQELVQKNPGNQSYALALARHLTYQERTRREGIRQLVAMDQRDRADAQVQKSLRQALLWLGASRADRPLLSGYLARHPADQEIRERLARMNRPAAVPVKSVRMGQSQLGFKALEHGDIESAAARFQAALAKNPRDIDALGGLGSVRLRQQAFDEALGLFNQAIKLDRRRGARWQGARDSARYWVLLQPILKAKQAGKLLEMQASLDEAVKLDPQQALGQVLLGDLWLEKGQYAKAEPIYRAVLKSSGFDAGAFRGLNAVLLQTGREQEALTQISSLDAASAAKLGGVDQLRANVLLKQAGTDEVAGNYAGAVEKLEQVVLLDPTSPWGHLALARQYQRLGDLNRADALLGAVLSRHPGLVEGLHARALLYGEQKRWLDGLRTLERIPLVQRSAKMADELRRFSVNVRHQRALRMWELGDRSAAQAELAGAESLAGQDIALLALVAGGWSQVGNPQEALRVMREVAKRAPPTDIDVRIQYAGTLLDTKQDAELSLVIRELGDERSLTKAQTQELNNIIIALTLRRADGLREAGRTEEAYRVLRPALERSDAPSLMMALARVENSAGQGQRALALAERVIAREPNDLEHRVFASGVALGVKAHEQAGAHADAALKIAPDDARALMAVGRVERELGNLDKSLAYFQKAQSIESARLAASRASATSTLTQFGDRISGEPSLETWLNGGESRDLRVGASASGFATELSRQRPALLPLPELRDTPRVMPTLQPFVPATTPAAMRPFTPPVTTPAAISPAIPLGAAKAPEGERGLDQEISALKLKLATTVSSGFQFRLRDGEAGLGRLSEVEIPIEITVPSASNSAFTLRLTPTLLSAGALSRVEPRNATRFGSSAVGAFATSQEPGPAQDASGVGFSVGYRDENLAVSVGTSPMGFLVTHLVGELSMSTDLDGVTLKGVLSRRAVTDSLLSAAGARDPQSLQAWGGVVKTGAQVGVSYGGEERGVYANFGAAALSGKGVKDNAQVQASVGAYWKAYQATQASLKLGLNLTAMGYRENLSYFTLGHGGYYSPQQYFSLGVPWEFSGRRGTFSYQVGGELGLQKSSQDRAPFFPLDAGLQSAWVAKAGTLFPSYYDADSGSGLGYKLYGAFEYALSTKLTVGGRLAFDNSKNYAQQSGSLLMRYAFDGVAQLFPFWFDTPASQTP